MKTTAIDIIKAISDLLTAQMVTKLSDIDFIRSTTTPVPYKITDSWGQNQYPLIYIDVESSETELEDNELNLNYDRLTEIYTVKVVATIKTADVNLTKFVENYIDAILQILHNYKDSNITWIEYIRADRSPIYTDNNQTMKSAVIDFEVRIN
jgi:hypothetical protein